MTPEEYGQVDELFSRARQIQPDRRARFLQEACQDKLAIRECVERLLAADEELEILAAAETLGGTPWKVVFGAEGGSEPEIVQKTTIGPYKILEVLGEGGMGTVYLAEQTEPVRRHVALKVIKLGMDTREVVARFEAERQALALMSHPNIASALTAGVTERGRPYFVMEHVAGDPITEYCDRQRLHVCARLELFLSVCDAIAHAHGKGVIHRDIKPTNVLVCVQKDRPIVKVIDFGVAKATRQRLTEMTLCTRHGQIIGTPEYMSPEQAELLDTGIDTRSDVYSLGVLLYELLAGATPFDSGLLRRSGYDEMVRIIREEEPPRPSRRISGVGDEESRLAAERRRREPGRLRRELEGDLDWITMKALAKEPDGRYASAKALAADIERHLRNVPVEARPPGLTYRLAKFVRRNRRSVFVGGLVGITLLVVAALWGRRYWQDVEREWRRQSVELARRAADLVSAGQVDSAVETYRRSIELYDDSATRVNLAEALLLQGQVGETLEQYLRALVLEPDSEAIAERLGEILRQDELLPGEHLGRFLSILQRTCDASGSTTPWTRLAVYGARAAARSSTKRDLDRALRLAMQTVEESGRKDHELVLLLSEVLVDAGRDREAVLELEKAVSGDGDNQVYDSALRSLRAKLLPALVSCGSVDSIVESPRQEDLVVRRGIHVLELAATVEARDALVNLSKDVGRVGQAARAALSRLEPAVASSEGHLDRKDVMEPRLVFADDFEGSGRPEWSSRKIERTPSGGQSFLGPFGRESVTLSLGQLSRHEVVVLSFDLYVIRSWDGNDPQWGPDVFSLTKGDGVRLLGASFCNRVHPGRSQSYPETQPGAAHPPNTGAARTDALGYEFRGAASDALYEMSVVFPHSSSSLEIHFSATLNEGLDNESWGVDNVRVELRPFAPALDTPGFEALWSKIDGADPVAANTALGKLLERAPSVVSPVAARLANYPALASLEARLETLRSQDNSDEAGVLAYFQGRVHELAGNPEAARHAFEETVRRVPSSPEPYLRLAESLRAAGQSRAAARQLHAALESGVDHSSRRLLELWFAIVAGDLGWSANAILGTLPGRRAAEDPALGDLRWALERIASAGALRLNCGGEEFTDSRGVAWERDRFYSSTGYRHFGDLEGGATAPFTEDIVDTDDDTLYQTERWFRAEPGYYRIPVPNGSYRVALYFAEIFYRELGQRIFGIVLEGEWVEERFEPLASGFARPIVKIYDSVEIRDGFLDIEFVRISNAPKTSAIEILRRD